MAEAIAEVISAPLYEITPETPYTPADLDWRDKKSRSSLEMTDPSSRPAIGGKGPNMDEYDIIFLGFPIWWYIAPTIINTFLESYDFSGKTIVLFATSGGSEFGKTVENLKDSVAATTKIIEGKQIKGRPSKEEATAWLEDLKI